MAWIVDDKADEHQQIWDKQSGRIKENKFISKLIREGVYDPALLAASFADDTKSIQSCIIILSEFLFAH